MMPLTSDYIAGLVMRHLYRQATDTLIRHAVLASEHGDPEYAEACREVLESRENNTDLEAA
jgi:hypothetical protein